MPGVRLGGLAVTYLVFLSALALLPGLGSSSRLTYHEAFVAQGAREMLDSGNWAVSQNWRVTMVGEASIAMVASCWPWPLHRGCE